MLDVSGAVGIIRINLRPKACRQSGQVFSGDYLMKQGIAWYLNETLSSSVLELTALE